MSYSIGKLGKQFGLSRGTLLYYDEIGLLKPSARTQANYRVYTDKDFQRLTKIMTYREAGMSLQAIQDLLEGDEQTTRAEMLETQLIQLNEEISKLRKQQQLTIGLLKSHDINLSPRSMNKVQWVNLLASTGMSDDDMWQWHVEFEKLMPEAHQDFLESLNIPEKEIKQIREKSRQG